MGFDQTEMAVTTTTPAARDAGAIDRLAAGRDRVVDATRAVAMLAVAFGHWLVLDLQRGPDGGLVATSVLARIPRLQFLSWVFQVMPLFFFAGGVVGFASWTRHREAGGTPSAWVAARLWRLVWPTLPVVAFWTAVTQFGRHALDIDPDLLDATRGIALVIWFLAIYAVVVGLVPTMDAACRRFGLAVPMALVAAAVVVDAIAAATGYVSSQTPSWVWVNYLTVWGTVTCLGRWWPSRPTPASRRAGMVLAGAAGLTLVVVTGLAWYPVSMVSITGAARSNSLPPTVALLSLGLLQVGLLVLARPALDRLLARPRAYRAVAMLGARAMTLYLWHLLAVAVLTLAVVLPGLWPSSTIGSAPWWGLRLAWIASAAMVTVPVVLVAGRLERPPAVTLATTPWRVLGAVLAAALGWAALALGGFHPPGMPAGLPLLALLALGTATALLVADRRHGARVASPVRGSR